MNPTPEQQIINKLRTAHHCGLVWAEVNEAALDAVRAHHGINTEHLTLPELEALEETPADRTRRTDARIAARAVINILANNDTITYGTITLPELREALSGLHLSY